MAQYAYEEESRYELIGGEERMMTQPAPNHNIIASSLHRIIGNYLHGKKKCKLMGEVDIFFDADNHFIPDLVVVCDKKKIHPNGIYGAPDLVVEILSPSTARYDRYTKKDIYEKFGVREYWLVNPKDKSIEVYHLTDGRFQPDDIYHAYDEIEWSMLTEKEKAREKLKLKVSLYDDLEVDVAEVFEDMV
ncbi:MAG: Uma2 family endonuclease [Selenomonadaceae bacterium]|nr:Uma2 family endonuclease [Selenomonadaceae bacterium]